MKQPAGTGPTIIVIFGATGDLTWRKLTPALYNLYIDARLPGQFSIIGVSHKKESDRSFIAHLRDGVDKFSRSGKPKEKTWSAFAKDISYLQGDFAHDSTYVQVAKRITTQEKTWDVKATVIFYLAVPPDVFGGIATAIGKRGLADDRVHARIVVEKPFGRDLSSANELNRLLHGIFDESQIYRIDHYLGKETVQNILAFRFANALFEPIWNRNYIDCIQISVLEQLGVENRGNYYETAGAMRDMIQNHLLQLLCLVAMEPPVSFNADEVRNRKVDVLNALRLISPDEVYQYAVRGQYGAGWMRGKKVAGYRNEPDVSKNSKRETYAAVKFFVDNWRWQGVPFYLRTGKRLNETNSMISIQFKAVPHHSFPSEARVNWQPNRIILSIQPCMCIHLRFLAKRPGTEMLLAPVELKFDYQDAYATGTPEAYETLLLDVMEGDSTLFMRADQVEAAWHALMPILEAWENNPSMHFPNYEAGMPGPEDAEALVAKDGHTWTSVLPGESHS